MPVCLAASGESAFRGDDGWREGHRSRLRKVALRVAGENQGPEAKGKRLSILPDFPTSLVPARPQPRPEALAADGIPRQDEVAIAAQEQHCQQAARLPGRLLRRSAVPLRDPGGLFHYSSPKIHSFPCSVAAALSFVRKRTVHQGVFLPPSLTPPLLPLCPKDSAGSSSNAD